MNQQNPTPGTTLDGGTYEIIQSRLQAQKNELQQRLSQLNAARKEVFGSIETRLIANKRIQTENNCTARDIVTVGDLSIFGYNVHFGLRTEIKLEDVFALFQYDGAEFVAQPLTLIRNEAFVDDFVNLYKYYKNTSFHKFFVSGTYLYMVFQLSDSLTDIKTFKWLIKGGILTYIDNRSDHEYKFPPQHDFEWIALGRDQQRYGKHPHISILDKVFVETVSGDLTIKVEDNTNEGKGIYSEPVENPDQTLDDGNFRYADLGNLIAIEIKPFQEDTRYFVYNHKIKAVQKIDAIRNAAIRLPDDHGLIFSNGYYLQSGDYKLFENSLTNVKFQERIASPNGEDFIYVFFENAGGRYVLMQYNLISQTVKTPIICNGFTILKDGQLCYFNNEEEATNSHVIQIWQTPFSYNSLVPASHKDSLVYKIGNKDIVRAMAECQSIVTLLNKEDSYAGLYNDLVRFAQNILDTYYWITSEETFQLSKPLQEIKNTANAAIDEYEKVVQLRQQAQKTTQETEVKAATLFSKIKSTPFNSINDFVDNLSSLRKLRGEVISLRQVRYVDALFIDKLEADIAAQTERISQHTVTFLLEERAMEPYQRQVEEKRKAIDNFTKVVDGRKLEEEVNGIASNLELLIDIVSNLKIEDTTHSTKIIDNISLIFSTLNGLKAAIKNKINSLGATEAKADFSAQLKLVDQSIVNYLDIANTPEKADELLNKVAVQLEDMEGRFADFNEFTEAILDKREEAQAAFEARKNSLVEARNKKAIALETAASRILKGVAKKAMTLSSQEEINGYFAADLMVNKLHNIIGQLKNLDDAARAETIETNLKAAKEDAVRKLKDTQDLYEDGQNIIKLGKHKFSVNKQPLELTIVIKDDTLYYHLTGTDFYQEIKDEKLLSLQKYWKQDLVSENAEVYRSAYLAYKIFQQISPTNQQPTDEVLLDLVKAEASRNYTEGYIKGVHDKDAFKISKVLLAKHYDLQLLRYTPSCRAIGRFFWNSLPEEQQQHWNRKIKAAGIVLQVFPASTEHAYLIKELETAINTYLQTQSSLLIYAANTTDIAAYLFDELKTDDSFCSSAKAVKLLEQFDAALTEKGVESTFKNNIAAAENNSEKIQLAIQWIAAYTHTLSNPENQEYVLEITALTLYRHESFENIISEHPVQMIDGMAGTHPVIQEGKFTLHYHHFIELLQHFAQREVPQFEAFQQLKHQLTLAQREKLRLNEFDPKVLTSFVRNKLIDQVYLPLFGNNLARQLGAAGDSKRTDRSGMLLLVSPPGYGKTTLMEYLANRLGLAFMKINGPAIGHQVTSVDPQAATNAAAREELKKLNLALEMGNNVMLYIDDIQHCNPELLQKFISLADGTRKMEGVYEERSKTYDLKGKRFCVIMAGNPYTESGEQFKIPDMLANRSDTYNLGDIIGGNVDLFRLSLIENSLTSNLVLSQFAAKNIDDLYQAIKAAESGSREGMELQSSHTRQELDTLFSVLEKVFTVRNTLLKVNETYIRSAAMDDAYRTEPPFKLQGSYRDMNKLVSRIVSIMNEAELQTLLLTHYQNESQTLTNAAEANLLKYKELSNSLSPAEAERWNTIKETFIKNNKLKSLGGQQGMSQLLAQMMEFTQQVEGIRKALEHERTQNAK